MLRAAIDDGRALHAGYAQRRAGAVHGGVAGADHGHAFAQVQLGAAVKLAQELQRLMHVLVIAAQLHAAVFIGTGADQHITKTFRLQLFYAQMRVAAVLNFDAVGDDKIDIVLDKLAGNAELRNDILHHAPGAGFAFKNRDRMPGAGEEVSGGETGRARADHRYRVPGAGSRGLMPAAAVLVPAFLQRHFFQLTNVERAVVIQARTVVLALVVADMAGNGRQRVALID